MVVCRDGLNCTQNCLQCVVIQGSKKLRCILIASSKQLELMCGIADNKYVVAFQSLLVMAYPLLDQKQNRLPIYWLRRKQHSLGQSLVIVYAGDSRNKVCL